MNTGGKPGVVATLPVTFDGGLEIALREPEKQIILAALRAANWNRVKAAEILQINGPRCTRRWRSWGSTRRWRRGRDKQRPRGK